MSDFPVKAEDKVNSIAIVVVGLATTLLLWASVLALQAYFAKSSGSVREKRASEGRRAAIRNLDAKQVADLRQNTYADPKKGTLKRLSIVHAQDAVLTAAQGGGSWIPTLGELNKSTVPAVPGKPVEGQPTGTADAEDSVVTQESSTLMMSVTGGNLLVTTRDSDEVKSFPLADLSAAKSFVQLHVVAHPDAVAIVTKGPELQADELIKLMDALKLSGLEKIALTEEAPAPKGANPPIMQPDGTTGTGLNKATPSTPTPVAPANAPAAPKAGDE